MKKISLYSFTIMLVFMLLTINCSSMPAFAEQIPENLSQDDPEIKDPADIVIGYEGETSGSKLDDLKRACGELGIQCVEGSSISELAEQGVDAIISLSNIWNVMGDSMEIFGATGEGFPVYIVDGEVDAIGSYNLAYSSDWVSASLEWMFDQMDDSGEMVYFNVGHNDFYEDLIQSELESHPNIQATSIPVTFDDRSAMETEKIAEMVAEDPDLGAIWTSETNANTFWGLNNIQEGKMPAIICESRQDELQFWKDRLEERPDFQCIANIQPGGNTYEAVYVAYYRLIGMELNPDALGGKYGNTLLYEDTIITNDNLDECLDNIDAYQQSEWGGLLLPPMTPEEIRAKWFLE